MNPAPYPHESVLGVLLAGGRSRRMGGTNKAFLCVGGQTLAGRAIARLAPQCGALLISANRDASMLAGHGVPVLADVMLDYGGPLAGILTAMDWAARERPATQWILSAPVDAPFLPDDLGARLWNVACNIGKQVALAASNGQTHFVCGLWHTGLRNRIHHMLVERAINRAEAIAESCGYETVQWAGAPFDPFFNVNTPEDLAMAETFARN